jgi:hypothetical protein
LDIQTKVQLLPLIKNIFLFLSHLLAKVSKEPAKIGHIFRKLSNSKVKNFKKISNKNWSPTLVFKKNHFEKYSTIREHPSSIYSWFLKPLSLLHSGFPTKKS